MDLALGDAGGRGVFTLGLLDLAAELGASVLGKVDAGVLRLGHLDDDDVLGERRNIRYYEKSEFYEPS